MMHRKALLFGDNETAKQIMSQTQPAVMKNLGRKVHSFNEEKWDKYKYEIVYDACREKFRQNPELKKALLATKGILVEVSPYDRVWGSVLHFLML